MGATLTFDIVVSAENTDYQAWQCMVFHHSCETHLGQTPLFVVHGEEPELRAGFGHIERVGGRIQRCPNFRHTGPRMYAPRNQMRTAQLAESDASHIVLCDPDMVFLRSMDFPAMIESMPPRSISLDRIGFLKVTEENRPFIAEACEVSGIDVDELATLPANGAPPHIIPNRLRGELCEEWDVHLEAYLEASHRFYPNGHTDCWIASMWGLVFALQRLAIAPVLTDLCVQTLGDPEIGSDSSRSIVHYSYPTPAFNKKDYWGPDTWHRVWSASAAPGRTTGAVCEQIAAAAKRFGVG
jgi:hypothetical protein